MTAGATGILSSSTSTSGPCTGSGTLKQLLPSIIPEIQAPCNEYGKRDLLIADVRVISNNRT